MPSWRSESPDAVKRSWWPEISRSHRARPTDDSLPLRCLCEIVAAHQLDEPTRLRLAPFHPWSPEGASAARRALIVRARARPEPLRVSRPDEVDVYLALADEPTEQGLLPALTDEAFALHRAPLERELEGAHAARR